MTDLEHDDAERVGPVVPALGVHLLVEAHHIETVRGDHLQVEAQSLIARRGVQAVGPEALVKPGSTGQTAVKGASNDNDAPASEEEETAVEVGALDHRAGGGERAGHSAVS